jgi:hypothetical protein
LELGSEEVSLVDEIEILQVVVDALVEVSTH